MARRHGCIISIVVRCESDSQWVRSKTISGRRRTLTVRQIRTNDSEEKNRLYGLPSLSARFGLLISTIAMYAMTGIDVLVSKWITSFAFLTMPIFAYLMGDWLVGLN